VEIDEAVEIIRSDDDARKSNRILIYCRSIEKLNKVAEAIEKVVGKEVARNFAASKT
jgi:hypothetical protein